LHDRSQELGQFNCNFELVGAMFFNDQTNQNFSFFTPIP